MYLGVVGPPNSPPNLRLMSKIMMVMTAIMQNTVTDIARSPAFTIKSLSSTLQYIAAIDHAMPIPRNTLTALLPVTFPIEESAYLSLMAATLLANVSAIEIT